jgi:hypothetical protein
MNHDSVVCDTYRNHPSGAVGLIVVFPWGNLGHTWGRLNIRDIAFGIDQFVTE